MFLSPTVNSPLHSFCLLQSTLHYIKSKFIPDNLRFKVSFRTNKNVKGININGNDFLLSQYADDTQIFLDGTEQSLREALSVLDRFYAISGLKINIEKTKAIWIGSLKNSEVRICRNYNYKL